MGKYLVEGGTRLCGEIKVNGAKNAVLPLLAATLLVPESTILGCPDLSDVSTACAILAHLGCNVTRKADYINMHVNQLTDCSIPECLMSEMRSSVVFLGAILARCGQARVSLPGGCQLGSRPIDLHLSALRKLGVKIDEERGHLNCTTTGRLRGASIVLKFPSVGATENIMLAACTAQGETEIHNAAREPEIIDLAAFLQKAGAQISFGETGTIYIQGVQELQSTEHRVIPDRIEAATYLCAAAITGGEILVRDAYPAHMAAIFPALEEAGCKLEVSARSIRLSAPQRLRAPKPIHTMPYPGFPTDAQSQLMALCCLAQGSSVFVENIFENRYKHAVGLARMGAKIQIQDREAVVEGVPRLHGAPVACTDLRGGAALVLAALAAQGTSEISDIYHIRRGYQDFDANLRSLGAKIQTIDNGQLTMDS